MNGMMNLHSVSNIELAENMVNVLKFHTVFSLFSIKTLVIRAELFEIANREDNDKPASLEAV